MNIKNLSTSLGKLKSLSGADSVKIEKEEAMNSKSSIKKSNHVSVSCEHRLLDDIKQELSKVPDFDAEKVSFIKNALKNGTFELDIDKISEAILEQHGKKYE